MTFFLVFNCSLFKFYIITHIIFVNLFNIYYTFIIKFVYYITTHRVKEVINEEGKIKYITQGDANNVQDPSPVPEEVLIGKVVKCIPKVGNIMAWMKSNLMIIMGSIFAITALLVIGNVLVSKLKAIDEQENKKEEKVDVNA